MATETEAKLKVASFDPVRHRLEECGARRIGAVLETNVFFDDAEGTLVGQDKGLRLRTSRDQETSDTRHVVTFKGPGQPGSLKKREEIEFASDKPDAVTELFEALGYRQVLSFQKRRESWKLEECEIDLDELPLLGRFVEVEGPDREAIMEVLRKLGLADRPLINTGYATMLARHLEQSGSKQRRITFESR